MRLLIVIVLIASGTIAQAAPVEVWECKDSSVSASWNEILVTATIEPSRKKGNITVAGVTRTALYRVKGFNRRWDFGRRRSGYRYAFVIEPNGDASYYDFGGKKRTKPSNFFKCRKKRFPKNI